MELFLKPQTLYITESLYVRDYKHPTPRYTLTRSVITDNDLPKQPANDPTKQPALHHRPSSLSFTTAYVTPPPTCRKPIVGAPRAYLPCYHREIWELNGGRYQVSHSARDDKGMSNREWMLKHDEERSGERVFGADYGREVNKAFHAPLIK